MDVASGRSHSAAAARMGSDEGAAIDRRQGFVRTSTGGFVASALERFSKGGCQFSGDSRQQNLCCYPSRLSRSLCLTSSTATCTATRHRQGAAILRHTVDTWQRGIHRRTAGDRPRLHFHAAGHFDSLSKNDEPFHPEAIIVSSSASLLVRRAWANAFERREARILARLITEPCSRCIFESVFHSSELAIGPQQREDIFADDPAINSQLLAPTSSIAKSRCSRCA
jgi:hypothetical protein